MSIKKKTPALHSASVKQHITKARRKGNEIPMSSDKRTNRIAAFYHARLLIHTAIYIVYHTCFERCLTSVISSDFPSQQKYTEKPCVMAHL